jgi:SPP1 gp7 family putative phage head morphogenesis protein
VVDHARDMKRRLARSMVHGAMLAGRKIPKKGKKLPRAQYPMALEREYGAALAALVSKAKIREAFAELLHELPSLMESAKRERGDAVPYDEATAALMMPGPQLWGMLEARFRIDADEGKRARALVDKGRAKLAASINTRAIDDLAKKFGERVSTFQRVQLNRQTKAAFGVDIFTGDKGMQNRLANFAAENASLITNISNDIATKTEKTVTRALTSATLTDDLAKDLDQQFGYGETRAKLIARDQIGKLNGQITASRHKDLGVSRFIWRSTNDERTREEHSDFEDESEEDPFSYDDPPIDDSGEAVLPGEPILCRCWAEPVLSDLLDDDAPTGGDDEE